jgi:hypothetical protein
VSSRGLQRDHRSSPLKCDCRLVTAGRPIRKEPRLRGNGEILEACLGWLLRNTSQYPTWRTPAARSILSIACVSPPICLWLLLPDEPRESLHPISTPSVPSCQRSHATVSQSRKAKEGFPAQSSNFLSIVENKFNFIIGTITSLCCRGLSH